MSATFGILTLLLPEEWLRREVRETLATGALFAFILSCLGWLLAHWETSKRWRADRRATQPMTLLFVALIGAAIAVTTWLLVPRAESGGDLLNLSVFADCSLVILPLAVPANTHIRSLMADSSAMGGGVQDGVHLVDSKWPSPDSNGIAYLCSIRNYGGTPLLNVRLYVEMEYRKAVALPGNQNGRVTGGVEVERKREVTIAALSTSGNDASFTFYVHNPTPFFVRLVFPEVGTAQLVGDTEQRQVRVQQSGAASALTLPPSMVTP